MQKWKLEDAKNRFSEVVRLARKHKPQLVTKNGRDAVVVVSAEDYASLTAPEENLVDFLRNSPLSEALADGSFDLTRDKGISRDIAF